LNFIRAVKDRYYWDKFYQENRIKIYFSSIYYTFKAQKEIFCLRI